MSAYATAPLGRQSLQATYDPTNGPREIPSLRSLDAEHGSRSSGRELQTDNGLEALIGRIAAQIASAVVAQLMAARTDDQAEWLDSRRAAEYLGVHRDTLRKLAAERAIPAEQDGRGCKLFFRRVDLDEWRRRGGRAPYLASVLDRAA
jgi:excisionase family DNA binding protein